MLRATSLWGHRLQNAALLILSIIFLPLDSLVVILSLCFNLVLPSKVDANRRAARQRHGFRSRTVLVTGVGMTKGLVLARLFYEAGHDVIGADFEPDGSLVCGRVSRSLKEFYPLRSPNTKSGSAPYIDSLLHIVTKGKVDLWVSCSGVGSAVEDGMAKEILEARTDCKGIQFDIATTQSLHEKHSFIQHTRDIGLNIPETHAVTSRGAVETLLRKAPPGRKYLMKTIRVDDSVRADMTLLPKANQSETSKHMASLKISEEFPWVLQQFIKGREYCTHSLVVKGQVQAFVACPSAELLMHYERLPIQSPLSQAMLEFTKTYASAGKSGFTGHLSFDFMVEDENEAAANSKNITLYPIECNPRAHTAVALFNGATSMVDGYLSALESTPTSTTESSIVRPLKSDKYYWIGHDLVVFGLLPTLSFISVDLSFTNLFESYRTLTTHILTWKDGTYEIWDPLPWWWLYHVYWPMRLLNSLVTGKRWSRINVSTTKMFEC